MRPLFLAAVAALILALAGPAQQTAACPCGPACACDPCQCAAGAESASVRVEHHMGNAVGVGTGTVVFAEGGEALVITNRHVCPDAGRQIVVRWPDGRSSFALWLGVDAQADLCALAVTAPPGCATCPPAQAPPARGAAVAFHGYSGGFRPLRRLGAFLGFGGFRDGDPVAMVSPASVQGDSGSGVMNDSGQLVAVVWGGTSRAHCVGHGSILRFLRGPVVRQRFPRLCVMIETEEPPATAAPLAWRADADGTPDLGLWDGERFIGRWVAAERKFLPWDGERYGPACPIPAAATMQRPAVASRNVFGPPTFPVFFGGACAGGRCGR